MIFSIFCALTAGTAKVLSRSVNSKLSGKTGKAPAPALTGAGALH